MAGRRTEGLKLFGRHPRDDRELRDDTISSGSKTDGELVADPAEDCVYDVNQIRLWALSRREGGGGEANFSNALGGSEQFPYLADFRNYLRRITNGRRVALKILVVIYVYSVPIKESQNV